MRRAKQQFNFVRRLSWSIYSNFGENYKCASQTKIAKNSLTTRYFSISRSFKVINVGTPEKVVSSKSVSICNHSHARRANSGEITISYLFDALVRGESPHPAASNYLIRN